jgi:hypothetical protein
MTVRADPEKDLDCDVRVGNGIACQVYVFVYDKNGHIIPGEFTDTPAMFHFWADDDDAPEYVIPAKLLAKNPVLKLVHAYTPAQIGGGTFQALSLFSQEGEKSQPEVIPPQNVEPGDLIYQPIRVEHA